MQISVFTPQKNKEGRYVPGLKPCARITFEEYLDRIRDGHWQDTVLQYRAGRIEKTQSEGVTPSGVFSYRSAGNLEEHSGIIALDFDAKDNDYFPHDEIAVDNYVLAMHRSISGKGWVVYCRIDPLKHLESFQGLERYFANKYQVILDPSGKDVSRFRFVSYDPELHHNPMARVFKKYLPKRKQVPVKTYVHTSNDIDHIINQITNRGINIADEYSDWVKIGMAFASEYGESGRDYFHAVSSVSTKYTREEADKKYSNFIKTGRGQVNIASFFWLAQQANVQIKTPRTAHIERVAKMRRKVVGQNGGHASNEEAKQEAKKILNELDHIEGPDVEEVINQVFELPESEIKQEQSNDLIADVKEFLRTYNLKFNEVTRNIELDDEILVDRTFNSIYVRSLEVIGTKAAKGKSINKDLLFSIIDSDFTTSYNPFNDFFSKYSNLKPSGQVDRLLSSIKLQKFFYDGGLAEIDNYLQTYLRKWLLSCVASWHGTYSLLMAVLTGAQNAGKTNFFRWLLPDELREYYAESKLDAGKDDEILMCQKAIICDDEYGGKSKQEYKRLKELLSKQTFSIRKPYGRITEDLQRIAVLCGTSNEEEIINDPTGNRRIIPIGVQSIDWDIYHSVDKTALWMELYNEWKQIGDEWMLTKEEIRVLNEITKRHEQVSKEEEAIYMYFDHPKPGEYTEHLTNTEILTTLEKNTNLRFSNTKLGLILKKCGFEKQPKKINGRVKLVYEVVRV